MVWWASLAPIAWPSMGLSRRSLGADEQIVVEVRRGIGRLVVPMATFVIAGSLAGAALVASRHPTQTHAGWFRIAAAVAGGLSALCLIWLFGRMLAWRAETVAVTTDRLVLSRGVLRRRSDQVLLGRVVDAHVDQRLAQRLVGRGDLILELVDAQTVVVGGLRQPDAFRRVVLRHAGLDEAPGVAVPAPEIGAERVPRPLVVTELDPTPPRGTPSVSAISSTADLIRLDEIDRLEAEGALDHAEADRRRQEIRLGR